MGTHEARGGGAGPEAGSGKLMRTDFRDLLKRNVHGYFDHINTNSGLKLSIQAGEYYYCSPRIEDLPARSYTKWEVAILSPSNDLVHPWSRQYTFLNSLGLDERWKGDDVGGFIPTEDVQRLFEACGGELS